MLVVLVVILLIGGGVYVYFKNKQVNQPAIENSSTQVTSTPEVPNQQDTITIKNQLPVVTDIFPDTYNNFTEYEKKLIDKAKLSPSVMQSSYSGAIPKLKFYDNKTVVFCVPSEKVGCFLDIYNINTLEKITAKSGRLFGRYRYIESGDYMIWVGLASAGPTDTIGEDNFIFYKRGAVDFQIIPNSTLPVSKTYDGAETYAKGYDMGIPVYDLAFDESTKTLTASVFKRVNASELNTKIRTVKFILP